MCWVLLVLHLKSAKIILEHAKFKKKIVNFLNVIANIEIFSIVPDMVIALLTVG